MTTSVANKQKPNHLSHRFWQWTVPILVIGLGAILWLRFVDKIYYQVDRGPTLKVRQNDYYTAQLLLQRFAVDLEISSDLERLLQLDDHVDTLLLATSLVALSEQQAAQLKRWVKEGGHLIVLVRDLWDEEMGTSHSDFLDELGVRLYAIPNRVSLRHENQYEFVSGDPVTTVFYTSNYLDDASGKAIFNDADSEYAQLLQYEMGSGLISVLADTKIWHNQRIKNKDNGAFLLSLIGNGKKMLVVSKIESQGLLSLLWRHAPQLLVSTMVILAVWIITASFRRGALRADDPPIQRELTQHLAAAARFGFADDDGAYFSEILREQAIRYFRRQIPRLYEFDEAAQIDAIARRSKIDAERLSLLWQQGACSPQQILDKVKLLQQLRNTL